MAGHGSACSSSLQGYPVENEELHYLSFLVLENRNYTVER
jgi:hypothetical protein